MWGCFIKDELPILVILSVVRLLLSVVLIFGFDPHAYSIRGNTDPAGAVGAQEWESLHSRQGFGVG